MSGGAGMDLSGRRSWAFRIMCETLAKGTPTRPAPSAADVEEAAAVFVEEYRAAHRVQVLTDDGIWALASLVGGETVTFALTVLEEFFEGENLELRWEEDKIIVSGDVGPYPDRSGSGSEESDG